VKNTNAADDADHAAGVDDGQDEHAVVEERLGDLRVAEVAGDLDALDSDVLAPTGSRPQVARLSSASSSARGTNAAYRSSGS
jgi:hypothetical protein